MFNILFDYVFKYMQLLKTKSEHTEHSAVSLTGFFLSFWELQAGLGVPVQELSKSTD